MTQLNLSTAYHPLTDGHLKGATQTSEDMLRAYVLYEMGNWEELLPLIEFSYNNSHLYSISMTPMTVCHHVIFTSISVIFISFWLVMYEF